MEYAVVYWSADPKVAWDRIRALALGAVSFTASGFGATGLPHAAIPRPRRSESARPTQRAESGPVTGPGIAAIARARSGRAVSSQARAPSSRALASSGAIRRSCSAALAPGRHAPLMTHAWRYSERYS